ncbi:MAG: 50S ribosomal protein L23 [Nitrososphaerota archaeon]|nr:50S ribosomal protein L23 [Nitrososphaerota archaeon]MDG6974388.1 50S ribosomal protein L23 [Nitrososphaerota archaeon]MDG6975504.1 50S ribosomal protein L23 [Nitrososphaerota archaeon]MDG7009903.1 50S ribosomal protein L23 [Nitrososphaerota archaeon]MDG7027268.1 50S ribosomal protein L23 [Nitrososphaerota archaeon]
MRLEDAQKILKRPYVTERTFDQIERENKLCFIVEDRVTKVQIANAVQALYEVKVETVNTSRTIRGKKAFVRLTETGKAAELATKMGLV